MAAFSGRTWDQVNHGGERPGRKNVSAISELPTLMPSNLKPMKSPLRKTMQLGHDFKWIQMGGIRTIVPKPIPMYATTPKFSQSKSASSLPKLDNMPWNTRYIQPAGDRYREALLVSQNDSF